jgi:plasmid stability protein
MAQLIVRNVDPALVRALKRRAASRGTSAEAEHREILRVALEGRRRRPLKELLLEIPGVGRDEDFARARDKPRASRW